MKYCAAKGDHAAPPRVAVVLSAAWFGAEYDRTVGSRSEGGHAADRPRTSRCRWAAVPVYLTPPIGRRNFSSLPPMINLTVRFRRFKWKTLVMVQIGGAVIEEIMLLPLRLNLDLIPTADHLITIL